MGSLTLRTAACRAPALPRLCGLWAPRGHVQPMREQQEKVAEGTWLLGAAQTALVLQSQGCKCPIFNRSEFGIGKDLFIETAPELQRWELSTFAQIHLRRPSSASVFHHKGREAEPGKKCVKALDSQGPTGV